VVILSPEVFSSPSFQRALNTGSTALKSAARTLVVDEVHAIKDWSNFRPEFLRVPYIRNQFRDMRVYMTTATITLSELKDPKERMQMQKDSTSLIHRCNDRKNLRWIVLPLRSARSSFHDLSFLIPPGTSESNPPPRALIFTESCSDAEEAGKHFRKKLEIDLREKINWIHARLDMDSREELLAAFIAGDIWILFCTDAVGMVSII
jgi:superfamily II DNA helicase RecQ